MTQKILSLILSFGLLFQQSGWVYAAGEFNLGSYFSQLHNSIANPDVFRPAHLRYFSYDNLNNSFKILLDKGDTKFDSQSSNELTSSRANELNQTAQELLKYFLIGVTMPNDTFWVNLRPDAPDNIIDPELEMTDIGKIFLEADLQLKKDTASFTSPQTSEGKAYWDKLYKKAGELFGTENVTIPTLTRPWIVPNEIIIRETDNSAYVYKATLKVLLEEDYLKNSQLSASSSQQYEFKDQRLKELNTYSTQLIKETIIPKLTKEVNSSKRYAKLRQVYYSLILSRWFKARFRSQSTVNPSAALGAGSLQSTAQANQYLRLIDSKNLTNLTSQEAWDKTTYFNQYQDSFNKGEYNIKEPVYTTYGQSIRSYVSGGFDITKPMPFEANSSPLTPGGSFQGKNPVDKAFLNANKNGVVLNKNFEVVSNEELLSTASPLGEPIDVPDESFKGRTFELRYVSFQELADADKGYAKQIETMLKNTVFSYKIMKDEKGSYKLDRFQGSSYYFLLDNESQLHKRHFAVEMRGDKLISLKGMIEEDDGKIIAAYGTTLDIANVMTTAWEEAAEEMKINSIYTASPLTGNEQMLMQAASYNISQGGIDIKELQEKIASLFNDMPEDGLKTFVATTLYGKLLAEKSFKRKLAVISQAMGYIKGEKVQEYNPNNFTQEALDKILSQGLPALKGILLNALRSYYLVSSPLTVEDARRIIGKYFFGTSKGAYLKGVNPLTADIATLLELAAKALELMQADAHRVVLDEIHKNAANSDIFDLEKMAEVESFLKGLQNYEIKKGKKNIQAKIESFITAEGVLLLKKYSYARGLGELYKNISAYQKIDNIVKASEGIKEFYAVIAGDTFVKASIDSKIGEKVKEWQAVEDEAGKISSSASSSLTEGTKDEVNVVGGLDFTDKVMKDATKLERMGSFADLDLDLPLIRNAELIDLDNEFSQIQATINAGIIPHGLRILEFIAACCQRDEFEARLPDIIAALSDTCKLEELQGKESSPELRRALLAPDMLYAYGERASLN